MNYLIILVLCITIAFISLVSGITWYNVTNDTKIMNAKTCEQAAMIKGGVDDSLNLLLCKIGKDFRK